MSIDTHRHVQRDTLADAKSTWLHRSLPQTQYTDTHSHANSHILTDARVPPAYPTPGTYANGMDACRDTDMHTHTLMLKRYHGRADTARSDIRPGSAKSAGEQILVMMVMVIRIPANTCGVLTHSSIVPRTSHTLFIFSLPHNSIIYITPF